EVIAHFSRRDHPSRPAEKSSRRARRAGRRTSPHDDTEAGRIMYRAGPGDNRVVPKSPDVPSVQRGELVDALLSVSRAMVALAARSLADLDADVTLPQYRA